MKKLYEYHCHFCDSTNCDMMVNIIILAPAKYSQQITKSDFRKKEFEIWGADWYNATYFCKDCGKSMSADL